MVLGVVKTALFIGFQMTPIKSRHMQLSTEAFRNATHLRVAVPVEL